MIFFFLRFKIFFIGFLFIQLSEAKANSVTIPAEEPKDCLKVQLLPCSVSTGNQPRMFVWDKIRYELDRNIVMNIESSKKWNFYEGLLVVETIDPIQLHTPFADIYLENSKAMIHVLNNQVRVLSLNGAGIRVKPKGKDSEEQYLVPGFQNWYGGINNGYPDSGVATVIDFQDYSKLRSAFFLNHKLGFPQELNIVASRIKWAAQTASKIHKELIDRKMASLEEKHETKVKAVHQKIQFNKYLRKLFLKKIQYDY